MADLESIRIAVSGLLFVEWLDSIGIEGNEKMYGIEQLCSGRNEMKLVMIKRRIGGLIYSTT